MKEKYCFEDPNGADLKIDIKKIPMFWKKRISKLDVNPNIDEAAMKKAIEKNEALVRCPFKTDKDSGYHRHIKRFKTKRAIYNSRVMKPVFKLYKKSKFLKKIHSQINRIVFS